MSTPGRDDFHLDLMVSGRGKSRLRHIGAAVAAALLLLIVASMTTNIASVMLPMREDYLQALAPRAADGTEALALERLDHEVDGNTITVRGVVGNRTEFAILDILAVVDVQETTGRFPLTIETPVEPFEIPSESNGVFEATATMEHRPTRYVVKFRFAEGPFVEHRDERTPLFSLPEN